MGRSSLRSGAFPLPGASRPSTSASGSSHLVRGRSTRSTGEDPITRPPRRLSSSREPACSYAGRPWTRWARRTRASSSSARRSIGATASRTCALLREAQRAEGSGEDPPPPAHRASSSREDHAGGTPPDLPGRRRLARVVLLGDASRIVPVRNGKGLRAPSFLRAKPQPPSAASELAQGKQLAPAVVSEVGWVNGLAAIRSLGRAGIPVIAVDHRDFALGFRSSFSFPVLVPDPVEDEEGFISAMVELGDAIGRPAPIFPTHDEYLNSLSRHLAVLGERFRYPFPGWDVLEPLQSKRHQLETADRVGIAVPQTVHPRSLAESSSAA